MSNHSHLLAGIKKSVRSQRRAQPYDRFTKAQLWDRLMCAEHQLATVERMAARVAHDANNHRAGATGEARQALTGVRDAAYGVRDAAAVS